MRSPREKRQPMGAQKLAIETVNVRQHLSLLLHGILEAAKADNVQIVRVQELSIKMDIDFVHCD